MARPSRNVRETESHVLELMASHPAGSSHDRRHTDRVLAFAQQLMAAHGGDPLILVLSVRLHDIGREDKSKHGKESALESCSLARGVLAKAGVEDEVSDRVLEAIEDHDDPALRPRSLEGRILKDADFLAGFGAWGILRTCLWAGESGEGVAGATHRLRVKMPARAESLEFPESRRYADQQMLLVRVFLRELDAPPNLLEVSKPGLYIAFEGVSGSGKDTQIQLLRERIESLGRVVIEVSEPPDPYRTLRQAWQEMTETPDASAEEKAFLLLATRARLARETILPAIEAGKVVLSSRSYLSTLVYQRNQTLGTEFIAFCHRFMPAFDRVFVLDAVPSEAAQRLDRRSQRTGTGLSEYERLEMLEEHRAAFIEVCRESMLSAVVDIVPPKSIQQTADHVWKSMQELLDRQ